MHKDTRKILGNHSTQGKKTYKSFSIFSREYPPTINPREVVGGPRGPIVIIVEVIQCKVAREVVGGPRGPIVIIVEVIQCKVD
jgi:hypothetical protein